MKRMISVYHLSRNLSVAAGLASNDEHMFPFIDATCGFAKRHEEAVKLLWKNGCYTQVAQVSTPEFSKLSDALEFVFERTNHIDKPWNEPAADLFMCTIGPVRSTSVGDVVKFEDKYFRVASLGFEPIQL